MSISKSKVSKIALAQQLSQGISDDAVDALNAMNDRFLSKLFPKDANVSYTVVQGRVANMGVSAIQTANGSANDKERANITPDLISLTSVNKMIRAYAGNTKVPDETKVYVGLLIQELFTLIVAQAARMANNRGVSKISVKDIRSALDSDDFKSLKKVVTGSVRKRMSSPRMRLSKKKSASKRKKSASKKKKSASKKKMSASKKKSSSKSRRASTKKCVSGKKAVHSYHYKSSSGKKVMVKAYCRKKSVSK